MSKKAEFKKFRVGSKVQKIEALLNPDVLGKSSPRSLEDMSKILGFPLNSNGCAFLQNDRGLGLKYKIDKYYHKGSVSHVRTVGFAEESVSKYIPDVIKLPMLSGGRCVFTGTTSDLVIDHKDGTYPDMDIYDVDNYQVACRHSNTKKREECKKCVATGKRFDARILGYTAGWIKGGLYRNNELGCRGCYYAGPEIFRSAFVLESNELPKEMEVEL